MKIQRKDSVSEQESVIALAGVAPWVEQGTVNRKVAGLIPSQGTRLGGRPGPHWGCAKRHRKFLSHIDVSLPLSPSLPLCLKKKYFFKRVYYRHWVPKESFLFDSQYFKRQFSLSPATRFMWAAQEYSFIFLLLVPLSYSPSSAQFTFAIE